MCECEYLDDECEYWYMGMCELDERLNVCPHSKLYKQLQEFRDNSQMSLNLKQDIIQAVRKANCPLYQANSHACWGCPHAIDIHSGYLGYICNNDKFDRKTYKVKPKKVKRGNK